MRDSTGASPLHTAAIAGHSATLHQLVLAGAVVDAVNEEGMTALHTAAAYSQSDAVRALLEVGASVNASDHEGFTPLDWYVAVCVSP